MLPRGTGPCAVTVPGPLAIGAGDGDQVFVSRVVGVEHGAATGIRETLDTPGGVVADLEELPGRMGQPCEQAIGPGGGDAVAVGVLDKVHTAVATVACHHPVALAQL